MTRSPLSILAPLSLLTCVSAQWQPALAAVEPGGEVVGCAAAADDTGNVLLFGGVDATWA